jgi:hypothetical protein
MSNGKTSDLQVHGALYSACIAQMPGFKLPQMEHYVQWYHHRPQLMCMSAQRMCNQICIAHTCRSNSAVAAAQCMHEHTVLQPMCCKRTSSSLLSMGTGGCAAAMRWLRTMGAHVLESRGFGGIPPYLSKAWTPPAAAAVAAATANAGAAHVAHLLVDCPSFQQNAALL